MKQRRWGVEWDILSESPVFQSVFVATCTSVFQRRSKRNCSVLHFYLQISIWPHESLCFCNNLELSDPTIAEATVCCEHMYKYLVIESDVDSFLEGERRGGLERWKMGRIWSPAKFPKEQFTVLDEYTVTVTCELRGCVCAEDGGMLSGSREHLSFLEFSFLFPPAF